MTHGRVTSRGGVHAMSITPFGRDGAVDERLFRDHLRFLANSGVGVYVASQGSGEGDLLSFDEKVTLYRIAAEELGGRTPVAAAGIGLAMSTATTTALAVAAEHAGVDAVQLVGPRPGPLRLREDELEAHFRHVVEALTCDVHLSNNVALAGYEIPVALVERLVADYPHVRVVNVSDTDLDALRAYVRRLVAHVEVRVGIVREMAALHALGARGVLCFEPNVAPRLAAAAWAGLGRGEPDGADALVALLKLNAILTRGGNPRSLKAALRMLGRDGGALRAPYLPLSDAQEAELATELRLLAPA